MIHFLEKFVMFFFVLFKLFRVVQLDDFFSLQLRNAPGLQLTFPDSG